MTTTRVLVTGASGFIGRAMTGYLVTHRPKWRLMAVDRVAGARVTELDLTRNTALLTLISEWRPDLTFHLAGDATVRAWPELYARNVETTASLLDALASRAPGSTVVVPGSAAEYGIIDNPPAREDLLPRPLTPYGVAKAWQTTLTRFYATRGLCTVVGRIFNVTGPHLPTASVLGSAVQQLGALMRGARPAFVELGWLGAQRDFLDVDDVCSALVMLGEHGQSGETYNVCSGIATDVSTAVHMLVSAFGLDAEILATSDARSAADIPISVGDNTKLMALGWRQQVPLGESLRRSSS